MLSKRAFTNLAACAAFAMASGPAVAQVPASAPSASAPAAESPTAWIDRFVTLNVVPHLRIHAAHDELTKQAALAMVTEHLPRVRALMAAWWQQELAAEQPQLAADRTIARLYNEFALWSLDSTGPAHDALVLQALQSETACHPLAEPVTEFDQRLTRLRSLPPEALTQALGHERALLARWGQPRQLQAAKPLPVAAWLEKVRKGDTAGLLPLPGTLRAYGPDARPGQRKEASRARALDRCLLNHWALRSELARPELQADAAARALALARFREGVAIQLPELLWTSREAAGTPLKSDDGYPELPKRFGVEGTVTLVVELDGKGNLLNAQVHDRQLRVPGIPADVRPAAFEALLDEASLAKAKAMTYRAPVGDKLKDGVMRATQPFVWALQ